MLFNEPKLLKFDALLLEEDDTLNFSALQRAEIAEIQRERAIPRCSLHFSALQRAEIAEISMDGIWSILFSDFSALQRAEIAEMIRVSRCGRRRCHFSALQRAEIAEIGGVLVWRCRTIQFQCSSTSRNC